jgi:DNA-binding LytR/AlgR family response regulator
MNANGFDPIGPGAPGAPPMAGVQTVPVNPNLVQSLQALLDQARRGEFTSMIVIGARQHEMTCFDTLVVGDVPAVLVLMLGSMQISSAKLANMLASMQQAQQQPSRIVRPPPGLNLGS